MTIAVVLGASGFIGTHACREFHASGFEVHGLVRPSSDVTHVSEFVTQFHEVSGPDAAADVLRQFEEPVSFVQCANEYGRKDKRVGGLVDTNVRLPLACLETMVETEGSTFIHLDTCFTLDYPYLRPYTLSKSQMADWGRELSSQSECRFVNLELQHPIGEFDRPGKFVPWLITQCLKGEALDMTPGDQKKDFTYVGDVAKAIVRIAESGDSLDSGYHHYECGSGKATPLRSLVEMVHELTASASTLRFGALPHRPNEIMFSQADISSLSQLGWKPETELRDGLVRTIDFYRSRLEK